MKIAVLAALIVAVSSGRLVSEPSADQPQGPWQVGKLYKFDVESHTLARMAGSASAGGSYRARFIIRAKAPNRLEAKLDNPEHASVHQQLNRHEPMPEELSYQTVPNLDKPFEINVDGGRIVSLSLPTGLPLAYENLLKGLIGALQVDLSTYRNIHSSYDTYDNENQQGLFRKMETDVTGDCETLYAVSPVASEWRRELPMFANNEQPIEVTKSKSYGHCRHRVDYHYGVPEGAEWTGTAHSTKEDQLIKRSTVSHYLMGKNGPIYKAETTSTVNVNPHMYGKQQAEVHSKINVQLVGFEDDSQPEWEKPESAREVMNLLYSLTAKQVTIDDTSSSSESQESMESRAKQSSRVRRSSKSKPSIVAVNKIIIKKRSEEDSSSSSSSDSESAYVNEDVPKVNEAVYTALYMDPQPRGDKKQNPMNAQKLVQEMAQQLQTPNNMPKSDFLSKFNILVRVVSSMSYGQLAQTSRSIEIGKSSADVIKADMWRIYRDAVAQAGTLPAFQLINTWIQEKKIQGEEAAEVVAVLPRTLRYPTKEAMTQFFDLALSPWVKDEMYLNTSALLAASKFIHMGQVDNRTAHGYYPTHMYGRLSNRHDRFVLDNILPRLNAELKSAIEQNDSHKAQVHIKAIGILGHRAILEVFTPYLERKVPVSTYLRTQMIDSLRVLAIEKDRYVRAALYSILRNTAEPYEVRVAAVFNIFMTHPTSAMLQAMAEMTKSDPSVEVRAAIKSGIEYAAELHHPRFFKLARSAQAVKAMVTNENFGTQYSTKAMRSYDRDDDVGAFGVWSSIGGDDSLLPKYGRYSWQSRIGGWFRESTISTAWSSWQPLINYYREYINKETRQSKSQSTEHKYSAEKIYSMFNNKNNDNKNQESAEASLYLDFMNQQRVFAFGEEDLKQWPQKFRNFLMDLSNGMDSQYTKVVNKNQVYIMFPVASGMPFIFKYKEPAVIHAQTKTNGEAYLDSKGGFNKKMDQEIIFTYAENHDGSVGFLDTVTNQYAGVGVVGKIQVNAPFKVHFELKSGEMKFVLSPLQPEQDTNVLHYSIWPYSTNQKKDSLVTVSQDPSTRLISRDSKSIAVDYKFGQQFGTQFQLNGYSYSNDYRNVIKMVLARDPLSHIMAPFNQNDLGQTNFNLRFLGKQSKTKSMTITAVYDTFHNQKVEGQLPSEATDVTDTSPNSAARRDEIVKRIVSGMNKARAHVLDLSACFEGPQKLEYVMTSAISNSDVDSKVQFAIFAGRNSDQFGNSKINAIGKLNKPKTSTFNYAQALESDFKMPFEADIRYGPKEHIHIQGSAERSEKYVQDLQRQRLSQQCLEEMANNNYYQLACHELVIMAYAPDTYKFAVTYNVNPAVKNVAHQVYRIAKGLALWQTEDNPLKPSPEGKLDLMFDLSYLAETMNVDLNSRNGELRIKNISIPRATHRALSTYAAMSPFERVLNHYTKHQYQPYCAVDGSRIRTFSNRRYNYTLSRNWHVIVSNKADNYDDYVVLARRPTEKTQEAYISYRSQNGNNLEIEIKPSAEQSKNYHIQVTTNSKKVSEGDLTSYWDEKNASPILEYYVQPDGVLMVNVGRDRLRIWFDAQRLVVLPTEGRGNNIGICGLMTGDPRDDYMTPNGLVDTPEHYAASYALNDENSEPKTQQLQAQARQMAYQPENRYTAILRSDAKWQSAMQSEESNGKWDDSNVYVSRSYLKKKGPCKLQKQVQYYENYAEICITTKPVPACQSNCNAEGYKMQAAQVVCRPKLDQQFITFKNQVRLGQNPKVTGVPQAKQYRVPSSCIDQP